MSQYVLKVVKPDMTTRGGFKWADVGGTTVAPDWSPMPTCGAGLHGWLSGIGDISCQSISDFEGAIWLALEVEGPVIDLGGKVKFQSAKTLFAGRLTDAASEVARLSGESGPVIGIVRAGGDYSTVSGGSRATVSGGDCSTVSGGSGATVSGGDCSTVSGGIGAALLLSYWDARTRIVVVYVGEGGVKPHTAYKLNSQHQFEEVV